MNRSVVVAAAVVERGGAYLVTRRLEGTHLAGLWEFPGGKCEPDESLEDCLRRELIEELGVEPQVGGLILSTVHEYAGTRVALHFFACRLPAEPRPLLGQAIRWVPGRELTALDFPAADAELIARLAGEAAPPRERTDS